MTSTAPSAASPGTTDGPPVPYAIQAVLQLANRLDEEAGWRDVSSLRKKATSVRRDLGKIDTAEADLETVPCYWLGCWQTWRTSKPTPMAVMTKKTSARLAAACPTATLASTARSLRAEIAR